MRAPVRRLQRLGVTKWQIGWALYALGGGVICVTRPMLTGLLCVLVWAVADRDVLPWAWRALKTNVEEPRNALPMEYVACVHNCAARIIGVGTAAAIMAGLYAAVCLHPYDGPPVPPSAFTLFCQRTTLWPLPIWITTPLWVGFHVSGLLTFTLPHEPPDWAWRTWIESVRTRMFPPAPIPVRIRV